MYKYNSSCFPLGFIVIVLLLLVIGASVADQNKKGAVVGQTIKIEQSVRPVGSVRSGETPATPFSISGRFVRLGKKYDGIASYGNGVFYFSAKSGEEFARVLAFFLEQYKYLEVVSIAGDVARSRGNERVDINNSQLCNWDYGTTVGYTVVFREK